MSNMDQNYHSENINNSNIITSNNTTYYSKNIKSISSDDYNSSNNSNSSNNRTNKHLKSISSENVAIKNSKSNYQKHYIPRNKRKVNQNSHHIKTQNQQSNNNMIKSISSDGYQPNTNGANKGNETSPNKSRMKRLSLTVSVSTQKYLEKIGKNNSTLDSDDIKKLKSLLHDQKVDVNKFNKLSRTTIFATEKFNNGLSFGEGVFNFGDGGSLKDSLEGEALRELGNQIQDIENSKKDISLGSVQLLLEPLIKINDEDIKKARELKRKQNVGRIRFEQAVNNLNEVRKKSDPYSSKTKQAKIEEESSRAAYNQITKEFSESMIQNDKNIKIELRKLIREYVAYQVEYFRESLESWEEFSEDLEEILPSSEETTVESPLTLKKTITSTNSNSNKNHKKKKSKDNEDDDDDSSNDDDILNQI